jgi:hypothetical protein
MGWTDCVVLLGSWILVVWCEVVLVDLMLYFWSLV